MISLLKKKKKNTEQFIIDTILNQFEYFQYHLNNNNFIANNDEFIKLLNRMDYLVKLLHQTDKIIIKKDNLTSDNTHIQQLINLSNTYIDLKMDKKSHNIREGVFFYLNDFEYEIIQSVEDLKDTLDKINIRNINSNTSDNLSEQINQIISLFSMAKYIYEGKPANLIILFESFDNKKRLLVPEQFYKNFIFNKTDLNIEQFEEINKQAELLLKSSIEKNKLKNIEYYNINKKPRKRL